MARSTTITVVGAGVIGLTTALVLSNNPKNRVLVVAEFMPGDYDIGYASCWAGANFFPMGEKGSLQAKLEEKSWPIFKHLAQTTPEACIQFQDAVLYTRDEDVNTAEPPFVRAGVEHWWKDLLDNYAPISTSALPPGVAAGCQFTTVCINTALYLPYLVAQCRRRGVTFRRQKLDHIKEASQVPHEDGRTADLVINATGLGARYLNGVEDDQMVPARGQIALVRNEPSVMMAVSPGPNGQGFGYCMTRAAGGGTILGGCYQVNSSDSVPDLNLAQRFMKICVEICPSLVAPGEGVEGLKAVRYGVGLRPVRKSGVRIEMDSLEGGTTKMIHCYGHGGWGYQASWATADAVAQLARGAMAPVEARL